MKIPEAEIDAGAQALRQRMQGMKKLNPWDRLPKGAKRKWLDHSTCVLTAAAKVRSSSVRGIGE